MEKYVQRRRRDLGETNGRGGDWLIARSTHLDQLDQLISATGIWKEQMARNYTSWSIYQCSVSHSRYVSSQKTFLCLCELHMPVTNCRELKLKIRK